MNRRAPFGPRRSAAFNFEAKLLSLGLIIDRYSLRRGLIQLQQCTHFLDLR